MNRTELLQGLRDELAEAKRYVDDLRLAIAALERRGSTTERGERARKAGTSSGLPTTAPLIVQILDESDREWTGKELADEMLRRGWETASKNPADAAKATLARLVNSNRIRRVRDGVYARVEGGNGTGASTATLGLVDATRATEHNRSSVG